MARKDAQGGLLNEGFYFTDGGLETTLIYEYGVELTHFAAFELLCSAEGRNMLVRYFNGYLNVARRHKINFILGTPTWRASKDWGYRLGYSAKEMAQINRDAVGFMRNMKAALPGGQVDVLVSGNIGPRGDGYVVDTAMEVAEARDYHMDQIKVLAGAGVDAITAMTINYSDEAAGIVMAARDMSLPVIISFTLNDGLLPGGESLREAIEKTDEKTGGYAAYFMLNCVHPDHLVKLFEEDGDWLRRIKGIRANASTKSHEELDDSGVLDGGDKDQFAAGYAEIHRLLPDLQVFGGCCGTDSTHLALMCETFLDCN